jgi:ribosomal protein L7/L12
MKRMSKEIRFPAAAIAAIANGNRLEAIKLVREANHGVDLRGAMEAVEAHVSGKRGFPVDPAPPTTSVTYSGLPAEAMAALSNGQVIEAIKIVREKTGLGLKEAKDLVDGYRHGDTPPRDQAMRAKLEAVAGKHGFKVPEEVMTAMESGDLKTAMKRLRQARETGGNTVPTGLHAGQASRGTGTVSRETNRNGWLWALVLLGAVAAGWVLLTP